MAIRVGAMKLDAVQLHQALDDMFAWAMPHLRDEVTEEQSTCDGIKPKDGWRRAIEHNSAEIMIEYSDKKYFCYINGYDEEKQLFQISGISLWDHTEKHTWQGPPDLHWRILDEDGQDFEALAAWLLEWAIDA